MDHEPLVDNVDSVSRRKRAPFPPPSPTVPLTEPPVTGYEYEPVPENEKSLCHLSSVLALPEVNFHSSIAGT